MVKHNKTAYGIIFLSALFFILFVDVPVIKPSAYTVIQNHRLSKALDMSSEPVYLPVGNDRPHSVFATNFGWRNAYSISFGNRSTGETAGYYQFSDTSIYPAKSGGPSEQDIAPLKRVLNGEGCAASENNLSICRLQPEGREFVVRKIGKVKLISELTQQWPDPKGGYVYNRMTDRKTIVATKRIISEAVPVSLQEAKPRYFKPSNY